MYLEAESQFDQFIDKRRIFAAVAFHEHLADSVQVVLRAPPLARRVNHLLVDDVTDDSFDFDATETTFLASHDGQNVDDVPDVVRCFVLHDFNRQRVDSKIDGKDVVSDHETDVDSWNLDNLEREIIVPNWFLVPVLVLQQGEDAVEFFFGSDDHDVVICRSFAIDHVADRATEQVSTNLEVHDVSDDSLLQQRLHRESQLRLESLAVERCVFWWCDCTVGG